MYNYDSRYTYVRYHSDTITGENATEAVVCTEERREKIPQSKCNIFAYIRRLKTRKKFVCFGTVSVI